MFDHSPFPGMDPWLEQFWPDVHHKVINDVADQLAASVPAGLYVAVERDLYVVDPDTTDRPATIRFDTAVLDAGADAAAMADSDPDGGVAVAEPIRIIVPTDPVPLAHVELRDVREGNPLVTAVEILSPTNKRDARARQEYQRKRQLYYNAGASVVEVDLLRGGPLVIDVPMRRVRPADRGTYGCHVRRGGQGGDIALDYYPLHLRRRLPRIRIPLRPGDPDAVVDLQPPIDHAYARGRYGTRLDYARPPDPPLSPDDAAWAADRLAAAAAMIRQP